MRIKHAYSTLLNSESRRKYDSGNRTSDFSYSSGQRSQSTNVQDEEEFYGFGKNFMPMKCLSGCFNMFAVRTSLIECKLTHKVSACRQ